MDSCSVDVSMMMDWCMMNRHVMMHWVVNWCMVNRHWMNWHMVDSMVMDWIDWHNWYMSIRWQGSANCEKCGQNSEHCLVKQKTKEQSIISNFTKYHWMYWTTITISNFQNTLCFSLWITFLKFSTYDVFLCHFNCVLFLLGWCLEGKQNLKLEFEKLIDLNRKTMLNWFRNDFA